MHFTHLLVYNIDSICHNSQCLVTTNHHTTRIDKLQRLVWLTMLITLTRKIDALSQDHAIRSETAIRILFLLIYNHKHLIALACKRTYILARPKTLDVIEHIVA